MRSVLFAIALILPAAITVAQNTSPWPATGDVGIGTDAPLSPLHIQSATAPVTMRLYGNVRGATGGASLNLGHYVSGTATGNGNRLGIINFQGVTTTYRQPASATISCFAEANFTGSSFPASLRFSTTPANSLTATERMRIMPDGRIGIGTSNPATLLHAEGASPLVLVVNTAVAGTSSGGAIACDLRAMPTSASQRLGSMAFGSRGGGSSQYSTAAMVGWADGAWTAGSSYPSSIAFETTPSGGITRTERMRITSTGDVAIGTTDTKGYRLAVNGDAIFTKVKVKQYSSWPDYVFDSAYQLPSLNETESYVREHKHLAGVPSTAEVEKDGLDLGDNQALLLKKLEELTLYAIEQNKHIAEQDKKLKLLEKRLNVQENKNK